MHQSLARPPGLGSSVRADDRGGGPGVGTVFAKVGRDSRERGGRADGARRRG